jgi:hypothetical protein
LSFPSDCRWANRILISWTLFVPGNVRRFWVAAYCWNLKKKHNQNSPKTEIGPRKRFLGCWVLVVVGRFLLWRNRGANQKDTGESSLFPFFYLPTVEK